MKYLLLGLLLSAAAFAQTVALDLPSGDSVRIEEFYLLASQIQDKVWPGWGSTPSPLLLVTQEREFLTRYPEPPGDFKKIREDLYARPRQFSTGLLATFPAFGPLSVIVIGEPANTEAKTSTPWLFVVMHEHFHQLQDGQPGFYEKVKGLGLAHGDETGMWMLNYPFPYEKVELARSFASLRDSLLTALNEKDESKFETFAKQYAAERRRFFALLGAEDRKYLSFELWKEGIARYIQIKCAEAAASYEPTAGFRALPDYESFESYARRARQVTLDELKKADLASWKRVVVYSFGGSEGLLLDRLNPKWKDGYFQNFFTLDPYFEQ
jgi:hypothetical protein